MVGTCKHLVKVRAFDTYDDSFVGCNHSASILIRGSKGTLGTHVLFSAQFHAVFGTPTPSGNLKFCIFGMKNKWNYLIINCIKFNRTIIFSCSKNTGATTVM